MVQRVKGFTTDTKRKVRQKEGINTKAREKREKERETGKREEPKKRKNKKDC